mmetsp:Transcript_64197/g.171858  ORF Transcript_64197/g.171858 Transcript_64197/m.171858 type:complete len:108 (+) Transcript_64197:414-737(+)
MRFPFFFSSTRSATGARKARHDGCSSLEGMSVHTHTQIPPLSVRGRAQSFDLCFPFAMKPQLTECALHVKSLDTICSFEFSNFRPVAAETCQLRGLKCGKFSESWKV